MGWIKEVMLGGSMVVKMLQETNLATGGWALQFFDTRTPYCPLLIKLMVKLS